MPPDSTTIEEEGVLIDNFLLVERGRFREAELRSVLRLAARIRRAIPTRTSPTCRRRSPPARRARRSCAAWSTSSASHVVHAYMGHVQDNAEEQVRRVLDVLQDGAFAYELDDGAGRQGHASRSTRKRAAPRSTSPAPAPQQPSNFNAPSAVCRAAVLYVFRTLVDDDIPMNEGCLKPLDIVIPDGSMLSPRYPAAVVAGNVETSQCITDALYGALGVMAAAQGTMNNFTFGNDTLPVLRDDLRRLRRRARTSTAPTPCTPT